MVDVNVSANSLLPVEERANRVLRRLRQSSVFCYDAETTGLDWRQNFIVGHVFSFGPHADDSYYIPVRHQGHNLLDWEPCTAVDQGKLGHPFEIEFSAILAEKPTIHMFGHNFVFDLLFLAKHGIRVTGTVEDTSVNAALLDEFQGAFNLEKCCQVMGVQEKKGEAVYKHMAGLFGGEPTRMAQMPNFWRLAGNDVLGTDYAEGDGISNWQLRDAQIEEIERRDMQKIYDLEKRVTRTLFRMSWRGVKIDLDEASVVIDEITTRAAEAQKKLPENFNSRAPTQVKAFLLNNGVKMDDIPRTEKGALSFSKDWLKTIPAGKIIIQAREYGHLMSSFITPLLDRHVFDGRVNSTYHQMRGDDFGTVTGRLSCSDPNLQQVPKRNKELGPLFRRLFIPNEGQSWVSADYSQCEPRLLAHYGEVKALLDGYLATPFVDAHQSVATTAGIDREDGKRLNQTLITGGGQGAVVAKLMEGGKTVAEANEIYFAYFRALPEIKPLQKQAAAVMRSRGYIISLMGRHSHLERPGLDYKALNRILQCGNADVIKKAMSDIDEYFESEGDVVSLLNNVHDSLDFSANLDDPRERRILDEGLRLMSDFGPGRGTELLVPLVVDVGAGQNWSEATWGDRKWQVGHIA